MAINIVRILCSKHYNYYLKDTIKDKLLSKTSFVLKLESITQTNFLEFRTAMGIESYLIS